MMKKSLIRERVKAAIPGYAIAGKPEPTKIGEDGRYTINRFYSSFIGFFQSRTTFWNIGGLDEAQVNTMEAISEHRFSKSLKTYSLCWYYVGK